VGHLADLITYAKFQDDIFRGYDFTGSRISHFPIDFCMGLTTVQRDCAACDNKPFVRNAVPTRRVGVLQYVIAAWNLEGR